MLQKLFLLFIISISLGFSKSIYASDSACKIIEVTDKYDYIYSLDSLDDLNSFVARTKIGEKQYIIINGKEHGPYDHIGQTAFSPSKKSFAYTAKINEKTVLIKDNKIISEGYSNPMSPIYSDNGKSFSYVATKNGKQIIIKDGVEIKSPYGPTHSLIYSPNGKSFAYVTYKNKKLTIVKDGKDYYNNYTPAGRMIYSPDSNKFSFVNRVSKSSFSIIENGKQVGDIYKNIYKLIYSPDSKKLFFIGKTENGFVLMENGKKIWETSEHTNVRDFIISTDSKYYAFNAVKEISENGKKTHKNTIYKNGKIVGTYDFAHSLIFSPDNKELIFSTVQNGLKQIVKNGKVFDTNFDSAYGYKFADDNKQYAYTAIDKNGNKVVVKNNIGIGKEYDMAISPTFLSNGKGFAFIGKQNGKSFIAQEKCGFEIKSKNKIMKKFILSKKEIEQSYQGRRDKITIDKIVAQISDKKLLKIYKVFVNYNTTRLSLRNQKLIKYLTAKTGLEIHKRDSIKKFEF